MEHEHAEIVADHAEKAVPGLGDAVRQGLKAGIPWAQIMQLVFSLAAPAAIQAILDLIAKLNPPTPTLPPVAVSENPGGGNP